jgi:hypothetical protein
MGTVSQPLRNRASTHRRPSLSFGVTRRVHAEERRPNRLIPDKVTYEQAAPIFCAGYTVYGGLRWADTQPHERVTVLRRAWALGSAIREGPQASRRFGLSSQLA